MKRFFTLFVAVCMMLSLTACMRQTADNISEDVSQAASEIMDGVDGTEKDYSNDNNGLLDDNRETTPAATLNDETMFNDAIDPTDTTEDLNDDGIFDGNDGRIEDGDGNVGDMENNDDDDNIAPEDETDDADDFI